jgi:hypothetical protein
MPKPSKKTAALTRKKPIAPPRTTRAELVAAPGKLDDAAAAYAGASRAENTKRAYTTDFVLFSAWCREQGVDVMPALPRTVALYLTALAVAEKKVATIERALVAICQAHKLHGFSSPRKASRRPTSAKCSKASAARSGLRRTRKTRCWSTPFALSSSPCARTTLGMCATGPCSAWASPAGAGAPSSSPSTSET